MIVGTQIILRPAEAEDGDTIAEWGQERAALWGPYRRFQLDQRTRLKSAIESGNSLTRETGYLLIETKEVGQTIGYVSYTSRRFPDADLPHLEIDFGIARVDRRGEGLAEEAVILLVDYLFGGYPVERITAVVETDDEAAQKILKAAQFEQEGTMRRATYRDGLWRDCALYALLRIDWLERRVGEANRPGDKA
jgi:RimJ/RimL family protein N-acetyltransferase